jgi:hypothetical protein
MKVSSFAKAVALELADRMVVQNVGATHDDAMAWLTDTDDGIEYLRGEVHARVKLRDDADDKSDIPDDLIDKVVQMHDGKLSRGEALTWLRSDPVGREVHRHHINKGDNMSIEKLRASFIAKLGELGPVGIAKAVIAGHDQGNDLDIDENEFTALVTTAAQKQFPGLSASQAFSKAFCASDETGVLLRKAHRTIKEMATLAPSLSGGLDGQRTAINDTEASEAYKQLEALAEKQRETAPYLSSAQAFARAFAANPELAKRAHQRPAATTSYPFPR